MKLRHTIFAITFLAALAAVASCSKTRPSDRSMEETLSKNEADFNRLVSRFKEDSALDAVYPDKAYSPAPNKVPNRVEVELPRERWNEYRALFKRLGLSYIMREHDGRMIMEAWEKSSFASSESKSYVYAETPPPSLESSLDDLGSTWEGFAYKHVRANWYLSFERSF